MEKTQQKTYANGLRLVLHPMNAVRSVTLGVWVGAGSAYETDANNGISHLIEHMSFKGTERRTAFDIAEEPDAIGARINAFTAKEYTCYYTKSVDSDVEKCMDLLADILYHSKFDETELDREKEVVLEEISMCEDSPEDVCLEQLSKTLFGDGTTYGRTILGPAETVKAITRDDILAYCAERYVPSNIVISVVGNIDLDTADALVRKYFDTETESGQAPAVTACGRNARQVGTREKSVEQTSIAVAFPAFRYDDERVYAMQIASLALGGGMSSRLFQEVREKRGFAYSVYSYLSSSLTDGVFTVYLGTNPAKAADAVETVAEVLRDVKKNGLDEREFERGKAQVRGNFVLGQESSDSIMISIGKYMTLAGKLYDMDTALARIESVTLADCNAILTDLLDFDAACMSVVGVKPDAALFERLHD